MANPTIVQGNSGFAAAGVLTYSVTLAAPADPDHVIVLLAAGDKNIGAPFDPDQAGTTVEVDLRSTSVSEVIAWYPTVGGETVISGDVAANIAGANLYAVEVEQDGDTGEWTLLAIAQHNSDESNVTSWSTGTSGAALADGLGLAAVSCDSVNTAGTASWSNGWANVYNSGNGSTQAGLWVAQADVAEGATAETTLTRAGGTSDQHTGALIVLGKVAPPDLPGVEFLPDELGDDARLLVEVAWGADLTATEDTWAWTDVTTDVRQDPGISTTLGRGDEASTSQPAQLDLVLTNTTGAYSLGGESSNWPYVRQGTPVRVSIDPDDLGGFRTVLLGFAVAWTPSWDALTGAIPVVALSAAGTLRRLEQGQAPVFSALRRSLNDTASVVAYWPMEDGKDSTLLRADVGGLDMSYTGEPKLATGNTFNCSGDIADAGSGAFTANVAEYTAGTESQVRFLINVPDDGLDDGSVLAYVWTSGTIIRWDIVYSIGGTGNLSLYIYNADGSLNSSTVNATFDMNGKDRRLSLELTQSGSNINWSLGVIQPQDLGAGLIDGTVTGKTFGRVTQVQLAPLAQCSGTLLGHLSVQNDVTSLYEASGALQAHAGELASSSLLSASRMGRLCVQNGVQLQRWTAGTLQTDADRMGPQLPAQLLDLLREAETSDQGQLWDGRSAGLSYTTRRYRENPTLTTPAVSNPDGYNEPSGPRLTIDVGAGQLAPGFGPTHDDQRLRNKITATRLQGVTATVEDTSGPRGTTAVGIADSSLTVNCLQDQGAEQHAAWQVALGTVDDYRVPTVAVDLRAAPALAGTVLDLVPGDRVDLVNVDDVFAGWGASRSTVSLIVEGIAHRIAGPTWLVVFQCSPFSPWGVGEVSAETSDTGELVLRAGTDGSTLAASRTAGQTSLSVATASGPLWTTTSDDYPLQLSVGGVKVRATACSGTSSPQTMTVDALPVARAAGVPIALWDPRPLGL